VRHQGALWGHTIAIDVPDDCPGELELPFGWEPSDSEPEKTWSIRHSDDLWRTMTIYGQESAASEAAPIVALVANEIELWLGEHATGLIIVHAAAVALGGRVILVPGPSLAGKSTMAKALVAMGGSYLSDDFAPIDAAGLVHPFPRRLGLRGSEGRQELADVDGVIETQALPLGIVAEVRWEAEAQWDVEQLGPSETCLGLLANCLAARSRPRESLHHVTAAVEHGRSLGVRGRRSDASDAAQRLVRLLSLSSQGAS
jgi:hypothetical protein